MKIRSHIGYVIFLNIAPIIWYRKRHNTVESSTFSIEFIVMKENMDSIVSLWYKLHMFGLPNSGPVNVIWDNKSVVKNTSKFESILNRKQSSIAYYAVRWLVTEGIICIGKVYRDYNTAGVIMKCITFERRNHIFGNWA